MKATLDSRFYKLNKKTSLRWIEFKQNSKQSGVDYLCTHWNICGTHGPTPSPVTSPVLGLHFHHLYWPTQLTDLYPTDHFLEPQPISSLQSALLMSAVGSNAICEASSCCACISAGSSYFSSYFLCVTFGKQTFLHCEWFWSIIREMPDGLILGLGSEYTRYPGASITR